MIWWVIFPAPKTKSAVFFCPAQPFKPASCLLRIQGWGQKNWMPTQSVREWFRQQKIASHFFPWNRNAKLAYQQAWLIFARRYVGRCHSTSYQLLNTSWRHHFPISFCIFHTPFNNHFWKKMVYETFITKISCSQNVPMVNCPNPPFITLTIFPFSTTAFSEIQGPNHPSNGWGRRPEPWVFGRCRGRQWNYVILVSDSRTFVSCQSETGNIASGVAEQEFWLIFCWEKKLEIQFC